MEELLERDMEEGEQAERHARLLATFRILWPVIIS
jgi:hypothetical protein